MEPRKTMWEFLNSKVVLLILGFLFTGVLGSLLTQQIERATLEHSIRFSQLHEDRGKALKTLNEQIVDVETDLLNLFYKYRPIGINPVSPKEEEVLESIRALRSLSEKSRIFFPAELADRLRDICTGFETAFSSLESAFILRPPDPHGQAPDFDRTQFMEHFTRSKTVRRDLEAEFRKVLGVR